MKHSFDISNFIFIFQVAEQLDLLEFYVQKKFDKKLDDAMKVLSHLSNKTRAAIQQHVSHD